MVILIANQAINSMILSSMDTKHLHAILPAWKGMARHGLATVVMTTLVITMMTMTLAMVPMIHLLHDVPLRTVIKMKTVMKKVEWESMIGHPRTDLAVNG